MAPCQSALWVVGTLHNTCYRTLSGPFETIAGPPGGPTFASGSGCGASVLGAVGPLEFIPLRLSLLQYAEDLVQLTDDGEELRRVALGDRLFAQETPVH